MDTIPFDVEEADKNLVDEIDRIVEDLQRDEELARRHAANKLKIPAKYADTNKYTAVTAEEYIALCDRPNLKLPQEILVIEPIDAFAYIDRLAPAHIVGIDESGTSLELYRHRQESLTGIHTLGKITAHACTFGNCRLSAEGDKDNIGIYLSDCHSKRCHLQSPAECKIAGGKFGLLDVDSQSRIEIISSMAEKLDLRAPECHIVLRSNQGSRSTLKLQARHVTLYGQFSSISGSADTLILSLESLGAWRGACSQRKIIMTPEEFINHLDKPHTQVKSSDSIRVSGAPKQVLALEDRHTIDPTIEILANVDISRRHEPWNHPVNGFLVVSRTRKQEINAPCKAIRLSGSSTDLTPEEYRQWQPPPNAPTQHLELELF